MCSKTSSNRIHTPGNHPKERVNKYLFVYGSSSEVLWYMKHLVLPQDQFPGVPIPSYFSPASNIHFLPVFCSIVQLTFFFLFSNWHFPSGIFFKTYCTYLSSGILFLTGHNANRPDFIVSLWMPLLLGIVTPGNLMQNFLWHFISESHFTAEICVSQHYMEP